ncbi:MAG: two-component regulator propeller domain-containing protein, partial [Rhodothermales bacterium]|nr:two-component regulator propeller domain-containing protein [Rhodothermales bacterium]
MIRRLLHTTLCLLGLLALAAPATAQQALDPAKLLTQYRMDVWTGDDGLPQHSVMALEQTRDGYLWLGTQEGLVRFDGLGMQTFDKRSGELQNNFVSALLEDRHGALWIGTRGGGLTRMQGGEATTFTTADGLAGNEISSLAEGPGGALWIGA